MRKSYKCRVDIDSMRLTETGKQKVWRTDNQITYCCDFVPALFVWERSTKHNEYNPYSGYVNARTVILV